MTGITRNVREQVRQRANARCEYCRIPDSETIYSHHVDHILSRKHGGWNTLDNLAWACFLCNGAKGSDIAANDWETGNLVPLYNPRAQVWDDHFVLVDGLIEGKTSIGRATARILQFNHPDQVESRQNLIENGL